MADRCTVSAWFCTPGDCAFAIDVLRTAAFCEVHDVSEFAQACAAGLGDPSFFPASSKRVLAPFLERVNITYNRGVNSKVP
jgi:hypothetical protein